MVDFGQVNYGSRVVAFGVALQHNCPVNFEAAHDLAALESRVRYVCRLIFVLCGMDHGSGLALETVKRKTRLFWSLGGILAKCGDVEG